MANDPGPAIVRVNYHSSFGLHVQTICTQLWADESSSGGHGKFLTWNSGSVDADDMINDLVTAEAGFMPTTVTFDNYIIFTISEPGADPQPRTGNTLAIPGTDDSPGWDEATQATFTWRTLGFGLMKIVMLDFASNNSFAKSITVPGSGPLFEVDALLTDPDLGWSGRDNTRPSTFISQTATLNEKLRRAYRLT